MIYSSKDNAAENESNEESAPREAGSAAQRAIKPGVPVTVVISRSVHRFVLIGHPLW